MQFKIGNCRVCGDRMYINDYFDNVCTSCKQKQHKEKMNEELKPLLELSNEERIRRLEEMIFILNEKIESQRFMGTMSY